MPYRDIFTPLMQRLVRLVGAPAALQLARTIPKLAIDPDGTVLDYDRDDPRTTARLLIERYEAAFAIASSLTQQAPHDPGRDADRSAQQEPAALSMPPIRIVVVDDHMLVREGLVSLLDPQPDLQVVGQAGSVREAITVAQDLRPDVVLMDFTLPDGTGEEATRAILATLPATKIVFLTVHDDDERLFAAIAAGATGYLLKSVRSADLLSRLRGVVRGEVAFSPTVAQRILEVVAHRAPLRPAAAPVLAELTEREVEVLRLIVQGHTNRQIADALTLSVRTVEYHRANLTSKLGLHSRADLVRYATVHGLLDPATEHGLLESPDLTPMPGTERPGKR
jgi:two-component system, NarL family, response regulator NreC